MPVGRSLALVVCLASAPAWAYAPGSGSLYSANFNGALDADWEQGNGVGNPSPWTQVLDGTDKVFYADGLGPIGSSPTRHWARHFVRPTRVTTFSLAFEFRSELGAGYLFDLELEQRAPVLRKYRMRVDATGTVSLWRTQTGVLTQVASTGSGTIPVNVKRWLRLAIEPDATNHPRVRMRVWSGSATSEPSTWNLDFLDTNDTLERVHRFELVADGPKNVETWIDDLDAFGDPGAGIDSSVKTIHLMELSHLDIGFTEPPDTVEAFYKTSIDQVLANLAADPDYRFTIEAAWMLDRWWERSSEAERANLVSHLAGGRLRLTAGYASLHTTTAGHEELTRNLYWASRFAREHGVPLRTWITDDVPGTSFAVPEILARSGIEYFVGGMNTPFGGRVTTPGHGDRPFWWVGPDGSRVLTWTTFDSYAEGFDYGFSFFDNLAAMVTKLSKKLPEQEEAGYDYPELLLMRGFDNHYQGFHVRDLAEQWNAAYDNPRFVLSTAEEFFDMMRAKYGDAAFPSYSGDYGCAWSGSHANAPHTEAMVRQAHREGRAAEALLAAGSAVDGNAVPRPQVDLLYRNMLQVDEHSGAGGWPGYFTPEEMDRNNRIHLQYAQDASSLARSLMDQGTDRALASLPATGNAVAVVNPLGRDRDAYARIALPPAIYGTTFRVVDRASGTEFAYQRFDATGEILFRAAGIPSMGYRVYDLVPGTPTAVAPGMLAVTSTSLENDFYRVTLDPADGSVTSLYDKVRGKEMVDGTSVYDFNELASATKAVMDAAGSLTANPPASASMTVLSSGPWLAEVKVTRSGTSHVETTYRLYRGRDDVEIENVLDASLMPYVTNAVGVRAYTVTLPFDLHGVQIRSETTTRFLDPLADGFPRTSVFDWHNVEHVLALHDGVKGVYYAVDSVDAHALGRFSTLAPPSFYTAHGLVLSRLKDKGDEYEFEGGSIGPYTIEPDTSPIHRSVHHVKATAPSFDPVAASRWGFEALEPLPARLLARRPGDLPSDSGSFFSVDAANVLLYTAKGADDGDGLVFRMTELAGVPTTVSLGTGTFIFTDPQRVEQDEEGGIPLGMDGSGVLIPLQPFETATVRVRAAPSWTPITLHADKDAASGSVRLSWSGGTAPYTVQRAVDAPFTLGVTTLVDEQAVATHDDPTLFDGANAFYLVR